MTLMPGFRQPNQLNHSIRLLLVTLPTLKTKDSLSNSQIIINMVLTGPSHLLDRLGKDSYLRLNLQRSYTVASLTLGSNCTLGSFQGLPYKKEHPHLPLMQQRRPQKLSRHSILRRDDFGEIQIFRQCLSRILAKRCVRNIIEKP